MSTLNGKPFSTPQNINLRGGLLRFDKTYASNPFGSASYGLYVNSSGELVFRSTSTSTILGATGGGSSAPSLDAIYAGDQTLTILGAALTLNGTHATNDVIVLTNAAGSSGDCIQITNSGTGNDIEGTSDTWHFTKAGDMTANMAVFAGDAASDSITLTAGDVLISDGSLTITDADNAATLTITNDTATSESPFVIAGSGAYTGTTTKSFLTITPSGLTTGGAVYLPLAAITEGKGLYVLSGTTLTSGALVVIESGAGTAITNTTGALLEVKSGDTACTNAVLVGMSTAATDETILLKLAASGALALGAVLRISAAAMTTGTAIKISDLSAITSGKGLHIDNDADSLTTGQLVHLDSASTGITTTGRMFLSDHTGNAGTSATLNEFKTVATDETILCKLTAEAMITGTVLSLGALAALTTGTGIGIAHTTSVIANGGSLVKLSSSSIDTATTSGSILDITNTGSVAGTLVRIYSNLAAQTATTGLEVKAAGYTTGFTGALVSFVGCSTTGAGSVLSVSSANSTAGNGVLITSAVTTTNGSALNIVAEGLTTGVGIRFAHTTSVIADGGSMMRLSDSGIATGGATNATILDIINTGSVAGTLVRIKSNLAAQTTTTALDIVAAGYTTGFTGSLVKITGCSTTGSGNVMLITGANTTAGNVVKIVADTITTGGSGLLVTNTAMVAGTSALVSLTHTTSVLGAGNSVLRISSTGANTGTTTGTLLDLASTSGIGGTVALITDSSANAAARKTLSINVSNAAAVGAIPLSITNVAITGTGSKFVKMASFTDNTKTNSIWTSIDQTSPNGVLTAVAGDLCFNATGGAPAYCTGTNVWVVIS